MGWGGGGDVSYTEVIVHQYETGSGSCMQGSGSINLTRVSIVEALVSPYCRDKPRPIEKQWLKPPLHPADHSPRADSMWDISD